jgi:hypothetical protein
MAMRPIASGLPALKIFGPDPDSELMRHFVGALLPSEQMMAGVVLAGVALFVGFGSIGFWAMLGLGAGLFLNGFGKFVRVGGLRGELARERALHPEL